MAFREMLMNAIEHGAHFKATQHVAISYIRAKHMVLCRVKDPGEGFTLEDLEVTRQSRTRRPIQSAISPSAKSRGLDRAALASWSRKTSSMS